MKIAIIDYGLGNLTSVSNALKFLGAKSKISDSPLDIEGADKLVLPGVGAFRDGIAGLRKRGLLGPLKKALSSGKIYLGICLGLHILFDASEEGNVIGLGILKGRVKRFNEKDGIKVPHIGWNTAKLKDASPKLTAGIKDDSYFYFDHSYYVDPGDKNTIEAVTDYGGNFASMIRKGNIYAVQFHPERSQDLGLRMLENFIKL